MYLRRFVFALLLFAATSPTLAEVRLPKIFADNLVLQQQLPIAVWGWADPGEKVTVTFAGKQAQANSKENGTWRIDLPAMPADGKSHELTVSGSNDIVLKNVVLGEVWLVSGQSNMNRGVDIQKQDDEQLRMFWIDFSRVPREDNLNDGVAGWAPSTTAGLAAAQPVSEGRDAGKPRTSFSEVGYVFGQQLRSKLHVPVGLIKATVGGSQAQAWTPKPEDFPAKYPFNEEVPKKPYLAHTPGLLYQTMIHGMVPFTMRGVIWYQGENDGRNRNYERDLTALIESYRKLWGRDDMPFHMVQIAQTTYASGMLGVWEAQVAVAAKLDHCELAPSNTLEDKSKRPDEGNAQRNIPGTGWPLVAGGNPHPPNKQIVAARLANLALAHTYDQLDHETRGPTYASHEIIDNKVRIKFNHTGTGLTAEDDQPLCWFEVSSGEQVDDRANSPLVYHKAAAKIVAADTIEVTCDQVDQPTYVRFSWHTLARHNLANKEGLPAFPFRTDDLPQMWNRR